MEIDLTPEVRKALHSVYEEVMWLAGRPNVTPSRARAWYTHVMAESLKRHIRRFTGMVSHKAVVESGADLRLEHYMRIQTTLTQLVDLHRSRKVYDVDGFVRTLIDCESVHIVTKDENYAAMRAKGCYETAKIQLVAWDEIHKQRRDELWRLMLRNKVSNYNSFRD